MHSLINGPDINSYKFLYSEVAEYPDKFGSQYRRLLLSTIIVLRLFHVLIDYCT